MDKELFIKWHHEVAKALDEGLKLFADLLADITLENEPHTHKMLPKEAAKPRLVHSFEQELAPFKNAFKKSDDCLAKALEDLSQTHPEIQFQQITDDFALLKENLSILNGEKLHEALDQNWSFEELIGIDHTTVEALYQAAKSLYEHQQYEEASNVFRVLSFFNAKYPIFWMGLGNCEFFCHRYDSALKAYTQAMHADPDDPTPHLYSSKCYEELHEIDFAINALDLALFVIGQDVAHDELKETIQHDKERLLHKKGMK